MSQPEKEVPVVHPRRRINPPAHLVDYELGEPLQHRQPLPSRSQSRVPSPSTVGHTRSSSPVSQDFELEKWILRDEWPSASDGRGEREVELTTMLQEMRQENADLRRQASQIPEIISVLQEMRQQNAMLHDELQSLKATKETPSRPVTSPVPSQGPFTPVVSPKTPQRSRPTPAPRRKPPTLPAVIREQCPATVDEYPEIVEDLRNMEISSSVPERVPPQARYSDPPQPRYPRSSQHIQSHQSEFKTPAQERMLPVHTDYRQVHHQPPSTQEKTYRGPAPTIPFLTAPDPREFSRLRIALENILPEDATEQFKYQILTDHLKLEEALLVADSYSNSRFPFTNTMRALNKMYGQPHHLALQRTAELMDGPNIRSGDVKAFRMFGLQVRSLVSMLEQLGEKGDVELECRSHVSRLMSKLPHDLRSSFKRYTHPLHVTIPTLLDFADWLEYELQVQEEHTDYTRLPKVSSVQRREMRRDSKQPRKPTTILLGTENPKARPVAPAHPLKPAAAKREGVNVYCPYCDNNRHFLNGCENFKLLSKEQKVTWIKGQNRCWRCGRGHHAVNCTLKALCSTCNRKHLQALHDVNEQGRATEEAVPASAVLYVDRPTCDNKILLKVTKVLLQNGNRSMEAYAILDDGSERTIILHKAVQKLNLKGQPEDLVLRTVRQDTQTIHGAAVTFTVSSVTNPRKLFRIRRAFTANSLGLAEHTHPVKVLQKRYKHLAGLPLQHLYKVKPVVLIGSDCPHLITPIEPVRLGPPGGPAAVRTRLGWTLQGPAQELTSRLSPQQCFFTSLWPCNDLYANVEKLWKMDILPYQNEKVLTRSRQDQECIQLLQDKTVRVDVNGIQRYATPLLRAKGMPCLQAPKEAVLPQLRGIENRLNKNHDQAAAYQEEIVRLLQAGYITKLSPEQVDHSRESWYIPHHLVEHNGKKRVVFNCSFAYQGYNLNEYLLPGPPLSPSLLAVLLRFREHSIAISSDIRGMFHQVRLLPEDKLLLRFLWRDLQRDKTPDVYEWQVLPFGTTCSPCCATFALQKHVLDNSESEDTHFSVEKSFYVDNCLQSFTSSETAKEFVDRLRSLLSSGGFDLRQWASNDPSVISHLPVDARSQKNFQWLSEGHQDTQESTLGLHWYCSSDTLSFKQRRTDPPLPTMRSIYQTLASQYDPIGYIVPFTTRAKVIVQRLWDKKRDKDLDHSTSTRQIHIFCDASEQAYGSVAYIRTENPEGKVEVAFVAARSRVAPKKQQTIPRLELCAAVTGAQLVKILKTELTLPIHSVTLWSDSTTVLNWLLSPSCRFKVFVGTRVAEIQELTESDKWKYVPSKENPADDITKGKSLCDIGQESRWNQGPKFLRQTTDHWPEMPPLTSLDQDGELRKPVFCGLSVSTPPTPDPLQYQTFPELLKAHTHHVNGSATDILTADDYKEAELAVLRQSQNESFPEELSCLRAGKPLPRNSRLLCLAPEFDEDIKLIRVGGRLRQDTQLEEDAIHPIVLESRHPITKLIIKDCDNRLHHPGPDRVFAELRRKYWVIRGRAAVRNHQRQCSECQRWRGQPHPPRMADLPPARLRIHRPAFYSTGVDCFGPYTIKVGRRNEKRWGIIFKCMTSRAVHIDILTSIDTDSFLMALRRFISRRGKPFELLADQGTNFKGGERELKDSFIALHPELQAQLASQQIRFIFNPPSAPHFGGCWEREIRSLKTALQVTIGAQTVTEEVLRTVFIEIEGILNSKPIGYTSLDIADPDPVTPNILLMGQRDASLPQVVYQDPELLSRKRWRHSQVLADHFWRHFIRHYLPNLQIRQKWRTEEANLQIGDTVMIVDQQLPRALWPVGKIVQVFPGLTKESDLQKYRSKTRLTLDL
ncbi:Polyprotein P3 [Labeo rohita]|uniref:ribonuclease H n=1 Tax=Labeo rohita TaxID=84645 RepID=A0ABQ8N429_LABRO|nr:Polyprotein P3 [Labeo rohita]